MRSVAAACPGRRWLPVGAAAAAVSLTVLVLVSYADRGNLWQMIDLRVYLWAGQAARTSPDVYRLRYDGLLSFTYTPWALTVCRAFAGLSIGAARWLLTITTVAAMGLSAWLALGIAGQRRTAGRLGLALVLGALVLWLEPVQQTMAFGQVNAVLMVLVLADIALPERSWLKGIGIGLAAGFKLTPGIFIVYLILTRQWRAATVAAATFAATVGYGFLAMPAAAHQYWLGGLFDNTSRLGDVSYLANQSLYGALSRMLRLSGPALLPVWLPVALAVAVAGLTLAVWAHHRQLRLLAVAATAVTGLLISPVSWSHHWVWIAVVLIALADLALRHRSWLALGLAVAVDALFFSYPLRPPGNPWVPMGIIWTAPYAPQSAWRTWHGLQWVTGDLYVLAGLTLLTVLAGYLAVPDRSVRPAAPPALARRPQASPEPLPDRATRTAGAPVGSSRHAESPAACHRPRPDTDRAGPRPHSDHPERADDHRHHRNVGRRALAVPDRPLVCRRHGLYRFRPDRHAGRDAGQNQGNDRQVRRLPRLDAGPGG